MKISDESGRSINVRELGEEGPAVVLIHGWMMSSAVFDPLCDALAAHARVFAVDLRGSGGSDRADRYELEDYAADVAAVLVAAITSPALSANLRFDLSSSPLRVPTSPKQVLIDAAFPWQNRSGTP